MFERKVFVMGFMFYVWIILLVLAVIIEIATTDLTSIWFAAGALVALILNLFVQDELIWLQIMLFAIVSIAAMIIIKPIIKRKFSSETVETNVNALIGKTVIVVSTIAMYNPGLIKAEGIEWTAVTEDETFEPGDLVEIVSITGNKMLVKSVERRG